MRRRYKLQYELIRVYASKRAIAALGLSTSFAVSLNSIILTRFPA